jgi:hypothetical protein
MGTELEASTSRRSSRLQRGMKNGPRKQVDRDTQRLQQLGYDAVLGRDYTFWSSLAISWLNIGCIQVRANVLFTQSLWLFNTRRAPYTLCQEHTRMADH